MARTEDHPSMGLDKNTNENANHKQIPQPRNDTTMSPQPEPSLPINLTSYNANGASHAGHGINRLDVLAAAAESERLRFRTAEGYIVANNTEDAEHEPTPPDSVDEGIEPTPPDDAGEELHLPPITTITSTIPGSGSPSSPISIYSSPSSTPVPVPAPIPAPAPPISAPSILPPTWKPTPNNDISLTTALNNPITYKISLPPPRTSAHLTCGNGCGRKYAVLPTAFGGLGLARGASEATRDELFWRAGFVGWEETLEIARFWRGRQERESGDEEVEVWKRRHWDRWQGRDQED